MSLTDTTPEPRPAFRAFWMLPVILALGFAVAFGVAVYGLNFDKQQPDKQADQKTDDPPRAIPAPELDGGVAWLNTAGPLRFKDLRGKVVILDFWTLCCINCIHTLPDLAKLEKKYANELVVIGVHSPKFENEKDTESIRKAVLRYEIKHPVVNDARRQIWDAYQCRSWPMLYLIDPEGNVVAGGTGEGLYDALDREIAKLIAIHKEKKTLNDKPLKFELAKESGDSPLFFPGKVVADGPGKRLFIADSTHHRLVITDLDGKKLAVAGTGAPGNKDGAFDKAEFCDPQGMAVRGDTLYVADRKNHLIRELDLKARTVTTIAGSGQQGRNRDRAGPPLEIGLNSPWDVLLLDKTLYIAQAGHHQIWTLDLAKSELAPFAGMGREVLRDGPLDEACFAQPSGLATDGKNLYVADSEVSAVRRVPLDGKSDVTTLVGENLFVFGDVSFSPARAAALGFAELFWPLRLQHALGVAYVDGKIYIADTYNSKVKLLDPETHRVTDFIGGDPEGWLSLPVLQEPGGVSYANGKLYVADTNAHRIRVVDLKTRAISTLKLQGVEAPKIAP